MQPPPTIIVNGIHAARTLGIGLMTILLPLLALSYGLSSVEMGILIGSGVLFGAVYTGLFSRGATRFGVSPFILASSLMMLASGLAYWTSHSIWSLFLVAGLGFIPPNGGLFASALEEGLLSHVPPSRRTRTFAVYGMVGTLSSAFGALLTGMPSTVGLAVSTGRHVLLLIYLILGLTATVLSVVLMVKSQSVTSELPRMASVGSPEGLARSRGIVYRLAALFIADATGSGMVTTPLIIYWLHTHFRMSDQHLALLFFGVDLLAAASFPLAEWISRYIGLLNTAVFTHIPSSLLLMLVPYAPSGETVAVLLLLRAILVEMDVPTRQSYIASVVGPEERVAAAGVTSIGKQIGRALGPAGGGWMLTAFGALGPFIGGGAIKIAYDLTLWSSFRRLKADTGQSKPTAI